MFREIFELIYVSKAIVLVSLTTTMLSHNMAWAKDFENGTIEIIHPYINKPFALKELTHRLNNVFSLHHGNLTQQRQEFGKLKIDLDAFQVEDAHGKKLDLSLKECHILKLLIEKMNQAVTREEIIETV